VVKKLFGITLLSLLLLQAAGCYVYFIARLTAIRVEMREQLKALPDHELTLLTFSHEEFRKAKENDHEVKVNGKMHDIARVVIKGDQLLVYAIHDKAEDNLLSFLDELVTRSSNDKKPVPIQLVQLLTLQFISTETRLPQNNFITIHHSSLYLSALSARATIIDSPPPRS
jgi:mRNA-degrading endonuclease YafQ of YafQ-DinJ toxin-antitoxin module